MPRLPYPNSGRVGCLGVENTGFRGLKGGAEKGSETQHVVAQTVTKTREISLYASDGGLARKSGQDIRRFVVFFLFR